MPLYSALMTQSALKADIDRSGELDIEELIGLFKKLYKEEGVVRTKRVVLKEVIIDLHLLS